MSSSLANDHIATFSAAAQACWVGRGGRFTPVRAIIANVVSAHPGLFTAEQLLPLARSVDRGISQASIYRTLADLVDFGLLHESRGISDERCYAVVPPERSKDLSSVATLVCLDCGELHPLQTPCLAMREGSVVRQAGFTARKLDLRIEAECESLRTTGRCDRARRPAGSTLQVP